MNLLKTQIKALNNGKQSEVMFAEKVKSLEVINKSDFSFNLMFMLNTCLFCHLYI